MGERSIASTQAEQLAEFNRKRDEQLIREAWQDFASSNPVAAPDPYPGQAAHHEGVVTPSMVARHLERKSGRSGWIVELVIGNGRDGKHGGEFRVTPPVEVLCVGIVLRKLEPAIPSTVADSKNLRSTDRDT